MAPKSFGVDLNLWEWWVGKKNCRSAMALLLLGGCCCKQGQQQKNGSMFPHCCRSSKFKLPIQTDLPSSYIGQIFLLSCSSQFFTVCCHSVFNFAGLLPDHSVKSNALPLLPPCLNSRLLTIFPLRENTLRLKFAAHSHVVT